MKYTNREMCKTQSEEIRNKLDHLLLKGIASLPDAIQLLFYMGLYCFTLWHHVSVMSGMSSIVAGTDTNTYKDCPGPIPILVKAK